MKLVRVICVITALAGWLALTSQPLRADAFADQLLDGVRLSTVLQGEKDMQGRLAKKGKNTRVSLFMRGKDIQFQYEDKVWHKFHMRLRDDKAELFTLDEAGKTKRFDDKRLAEPVAGTDLTYEDLSFRFLYWPNAKVIGRDKIKGQWCHKLSVQNPDRKGAYALCHIWIDEKHNAMMQVVGFDSKGRPLKRFKVDSIMKVGKAYTLKEMHVETVDPATNRVTGMTKLRFNEAKEVKPVGRGGL